MLSPADMLVVGVAALLFFGPDQLPKVARRAGQVVRDVQATSASFIHEMERAADEPDHRIPYVPPEPYAPDPPTVSIDPTSNAASSHVSYVMPDHESYVTPDHDRQATPDLDSQATLAHEPHVATGHEPPATIAHEPTASNGEPHTTSAHDPTMTGGTHTFIAEPKSPQ